MILQITDAQAKDISILVSRKLISLYNEIDQLAEDELVDTSSIDAEIYRLEKVQAQIALLQNKQAAQEQKELSPIVIKGNKHIKQLKRHLKPLKQILP